MTQTDSIYKWLMLGNTLTPLEALGRFGCLRLGARIFELRRQGYKIETKYITKNGKTFAEYRMTG